MKKIKKIPVRKCVGCMENKPKKELIRIVKNKDGEVFIDLTGKANGRGAYICSNVECLAKAKKSKSLQRTLGTTLSEEIYKDLEKALSE